MVALCNNAETGVGPSIASVTKDAKVISRFCSSRYKKKEASVSIAGKYRKIKYIIWYLCRK